VLKLPEEKEEDDNVPAPVSPLLSSPVTPALSSPVSRSLSSLVSPVAKAEEKPASPVKMPKPVLEAMPSESSAGINTHGCTDDIVPSLTSNLSNLIF
jgi:hypothetical protein